MGRISNRTADRDKFLRLDKNENLIPFSNNFLREARKGITSDFISTYPQLLLLYQKIADWIGHSTGNVYIAAGSDAAIKAVFEAFVLPQDKVLTLYPTYAMFSVYAQIFKTRLLKIEYDRELSIPHELIIGTIRKQKPKLVYVANPNSPTGTVIGTRQMKEIIGEISSYGGIALVDEAYYLYYSSTVIGLIRQYQNLVITRTFSKAFGLASVRLGFAAAHKKTIAALEKVRPMYETNAFAVLLGAAVLDNFYMARRNVAKTLDAKLYLEKKLQKLGLKYHKSFTNFLVINVGSYSRSRRITGYMKRRGILIGGGYRHPSLKNCIRVTVGTIAQMKLFLKELKNAL